MTTMRAHPARLYIIMARVSGTTEWEAAEVFSSSLAAKIALDVGRPLDDDRYDAIELVRYSRSVPWRPSEEPRRRR